MAVYQVIRVVAVGHGFVSAVGTVDMGHLVAVAGMAGGTLIRVGGGDGQDVLVEVVAVGGVQVAVVKIVDVVLMFDCGVAAVFSMDMGVIAVNLVVGHPAAPCTFGEMGRAPSVTWSSALTIRSVTC